MRVLVTDANNRVALAVARALGQAGCEVMAVEQRRFASRTPPAFLSRHVVERHVIDDLAEIASIRADVVIPISTNVLLSIRDPRAPIPPVATIRRANDKNQVIAVAKRAGVPTPVSFAPEGDEDFDAVARTIRFPAVVKMRTDEGTYLDPGQRYAIVRDADEMRAAFRRWNHPVIQEKLVGDGYGCGFLAKEGELLAAFCHRRVREFPVSGGPSALCESLVDDRLVGYARALARELRWTGVAMAEFKKGADGEYRLLEINPRFWGSLPLALRAGLNLPHLLCRMAAGEALAPMPAYAAGVKLRFLTLDAAGAMKSVRHLLGFMRDLFDPRIADGIWDPADVRASVAYVVSRL